jgi:tripartite-type tricarboxylate transporter receptor subunit TctC
MKKRMMVVLLVLCFGFAPLLANGTGENKSEYPSPKAKITLLVPYSAGGGTDSMARMLMPNFDKELGTVSIIVNRPGAAGETGMAEMNEAKPDGYNLGLISSPDNFCIATYKDQVNFDNDKFIYIAAFTDTPTILVVGKNSPFNTIGEFVAYAKKNPGKLCISESGDSHKVSAILLEDATSIDLTTVNYDGAGDNYNAILGGHVDGGFLALSFAQRALDQGCKVLGVASKQRISSFSSLPTFMENGVDVVISSSRIITAPVGTPAAIVDTIRGAFDKVGANVEFAAAVNKSGEVFHYMSGAELDDYLSTTEKKVVRICTTYKADFVR